MPSLLNRARVRALAQAEAAKRYRFRHGARVSSSAAASPPTSDESSTYAQLV
jgi:hypothetical protein